MTEKNEIYRCNICGNMVEVLHIGTGKLVCCENNMELLEEKEEGTGPEKHLPVLEETEKGVKVKVGSTAHPMEENHCIDWIEVKADGNIYRQTLQPGNQPQAQFALDPDEVSQISVRSFCSIHGLWRS